MLKALSLFVKAVAIALVTIAVWVSLNFVRDWRQAKANETATLNAIVQILQYNIQSGRLVVPQAPQPSAPATPPEQKK